MVRNTDQAIVKLVKIQLLNQRLYIVLFLLTKIRSHQWFIEFEKKPIDIKLFMIKIDKILKQLNSDYEAKEQTSYLEFLKL